MVEGDVSENGNRKFSQLLLDQPSHLKATIDSLIIKMIKYYSMVVTSGEYHRVCVWFLDEEMLPRGVYYYCVR